jgi:hypothetical protein
MLQEGNMKNKWKLEKIKAQDIDDQIKGKIIVIPKYQRGIVWNRSKKDKLIETIKLGLPFGSILLYEDHKGKKQLIDGLQRSSTIFDFINNPSQFFNDDDINDDIINIVFKLTGYRKEQKTAMVFEIKKHLMNWIKKENQTMDDVLKIEADDYVYALSKEFPFIGNDIEKHRVIKKTIKPIFDSYKDVCRTLLDIEIPVILLTGDEEILPEVFERINSTGATLSKYQIFSAAWSTTEVKVIDDELSPIINYVSNRYDDMVNGEIEIDGFDSTDLKRDRIINIFDLCFGFGKMIKDSFPYLFGKISNPVKVESIGFNLLNACLIQKVNNQKNLHKALTYFNENQINKLLLKVIKEINYVDRILSSVTQFKGNKRNKISTSVNHTEYQIISIIAYIFIMKYGELNFDDEDNLISSSVNISDVSDKWKVNEKLIKSNILKTYIIDVLNENWRGSGDKKLDHIILNQDYYLNEISEIAMRREIDGWFNQISEERKEFKKIRAPKEAEKVFLNLVYSNLFSAQDQISDKNFDIEHLMTKGLMKEKLSLYDEELKLPISSIGNLCYLPEKENRSKGKKTLYEDSNYLKNYDIKQLEGKFTFTEENDFSWINDDLGKEEFKSFYFEFITKRYEKMREIIIQNLY